MPASINCAKAKNPLFGPRKLKLGPRFSRQISAAAAPISKIDRALVLKA